MAIFNTECPHCRTPQSPLASVAFTHISDTKCHGFFLCPICAAPVAASFFKFKGGAVGAWHELQGYPRTMEVAGWAPLEVWPALKDSAAPDAVPVTISRNFVQAEEAAARKHWEAAGMAYRRVLELTMKDKGPELKGTLEKRIDKLAEDAKLTPDIAEWAHSIRVLGNEAAHDEAEPTEQDITDLAAFTRVTLEYLFTMPAKVARRSGPPPSEEAVA